MKEDFKLKLAYKWKVRAEQAEQDRDQARILALWLIDAIRGKPLNDLALSITEVQEAVALFKKANPELLNKATEPIETTVIMAETINTATGEVV